MRNDDSSHHLGTPAEILVENPLAETLVETAKEYFSAMDGCDCLARAGMEEHVAREDCAGREGCVAMNHEAHGAKGDKAVAVAVVVARDQEDVDSVVVAAVDPDEVDVVDANAVVVALVVHADDKHP